MSKVNSLVQSFLRGDDSPDEEIGQTVYLTRKSRAQLEALSQVAKRSKTRTASQILVAALEEAINALPDEPIIRGKFGFLGDRHDEMYTPEQYVLSSLAQWEEIESLEAQGVLGERPYTPEEVEKMTGQKVGQE